jgi:hypothetical protein
VFSSPNEVFKLAHWLLGILATTSVHVSVEDTSDLSVWQETGKSDSRVSIYSEENQGVGDGLEAGRDPSLERLADLSVVLIVSTAFSSHQITYIVDESAMKISLTLAVTADVHLHSVHGLPL